MILPSTARQQSAVVISVDCTANVLLRNRSLLYHVPRTFEVNGSKVKVTA